MPKPESLRRGKPETRTHFQRARDEYKDANGPPRVTERLDQGDDGGCPTCHGVMLLRKSYKGESSYKFEGICLTGNEEHHVLRYGHFVVDREAPQPIHLDGED